MTTKRRRVQWVMLESGGRVGSKPADVGYRSEWQVSRKFIWMPRSDWPVERNFEINVGDETHQECNSMKENMMGPDHVSKPNVELFQGGYITNVWETLVRRTTLFIK